ncbi:ATP-dependent dethiobiotin synthetase BioD [Buchnera aphidicola (Phyllaphis fagi)]|uniref:dethiobiotin synthase n=1 Tax=Buchnera aphidicola TaxID=9 RepID=UPI003463CEC1
MHYQWFITGTDTNVGKTIASIVLLHKASKKGFKTAGYKPVSSGCIKTIDGFQNQDAILLKKYSTVNLSYKQVNPFFFSRIGPPHVFNNKEKLINFNALNNGLNIIHKKSNWIIIEGIGGWYTPISQSIFLSDWIKQENIPVILVVGLKLGCINHSILTGQSITQSGLQFSGWIANYISNKQEYFLDYINILKKYIHAPFLGSIPYMKNLHNISKKNILIKLPT